MPDNIDVSGMIPAAPKAVYQAWMDSEIHSWMTGADAKIDARVGGRFTAWDGYITGATLIMEPFSRIVQSWRTTDFPADAPDSQIEVLFADTPSGTQVIVNHTNLPDGSGDTYRTGWIQNYFQPMQEYFASLSQE